MSILEAISPTTRELLAVPAKCACRSEAHKVHAVRPDGRPLCGGGKPHDCPPPKQTDIGPVSCRACLNIIARK